MEYTEKEIKNIKDHAFDEGWRFGIIVGVGICVLFYIIVLEVLDIKGD